MPCDPQQFWTFAATVKTFAEGSGGSEVHVRNAVSRAYYACYGEARDLLAEAGILERRAGQEDAHKKCWEFFGVRQARAVEVLGKECKVFRVEADYHVWKPLDDRWLAAAWAALTELRDELRIVREEDALRKNTVL